MSIDKITKTIELKVGDYVRTDRGYITKISDFKEHYTKGKRLGLKEEVVENFLLLDGKQFEIIKSIDYSIPPCYPSDEELEKIKSHIIKSSPNIIDLIEYGDIIGWKTKYNGGVNEVVGNKEPSVYVTEEDRYVPLSEIEIVSIITHEQMEVMEYKIEK